MNVIGIIAEYNPFHNGHVYHIKNIKQIYKDSLIIVILNGNFSQRGDVSIVNKWAKTNMALSNGVDLVIELPLLYGINSADIFSKGALLILNDLKIDTLIFGSEIDDIEYLTSIATTKINNKNYDIILKKELNKGISYPKAAANTIKEITNKAIIKPNDILAISYIEEIIKNKYNINPVSIKRSNDYHSTDIDTISSATAIRNAIKLGNNISNTVPRNTLKYLKNPIFIDDYFILLKYKILSTSDLTIYHGIDEGIDNRIKKFINISNSYDELINNIKTKRYTYNRIKRILLYILLDIKKIDMLNVKPYIRPLGFNNKGLKYLNKIKKEVTLPLISNYNKYREILSIEYRANSIYSLGFTKPNEIIKTEFNKPIKK